MRGVSRLVPDLLAAPLTSSIPSSSLRRPPVSAVVLRLQALRPSAPARPFSALPPLQVGPPCLSRRARGSQQSPWRRHNHNHAPSLAWRGEEREGRGLGQARMPRDESLESLDLSITDAVTDEDMYLGEKVDRGLHEELAGLGLDNNANDNDNDNDTDTDDASRRRAFALMRQRHGAAGVWACVQHLVPSGRLALLAHDDYESELLRDEILGAALLKESRIPGLVDVAELLRSREAFQWPGLYMKIMHFFLDQDSFEAAVRWHLQLVPLFPPEPDVFAALLASFVTDPHPRMQATLKSLYVCSAERNLYDHLVPVLFASGQSQLARAWRKKLLLFGDQPCTPRSRQFLRFMTNYFPKVRLTDQELEIAGLNDVDDVDDSQSLQSLALTDGDDDTATARDLAPAEPATEPQHGLYNDSIVAKWFASSWTSVEFAINLASRLGVRVIGSRSLQALALREPNARDVAAHIAQLESLGIDISAQVYCKIVITFARSGDDELLWSLLRCDIHPDEFEDPAARRLLLQDATRREDWERQRLFHGIEWALESGPTSRRLNSLLRIELDTRGLDRARALLDRMVALRIDMAQTSANRLLKRAFWRLGHHPQDRLADQSDKLDDPALDRAIDVARRLAHLDVAVPVRSWSVLLFNLGRSRRLSQLEQLSIEILRHYTPSQGGLIPVHRADLPGPRTSYSRSTSSDSSSSSSSSSSDDKEYIPADLPLSHHEHPMRRLFDHNLQRGIVRWAFDQTLEVEPELPALLNTQSSATFADHDVARGVRLLAHLRDAGVLIDKGVLRTAVLTRIALGQVPGRMRSRARDSREMSVEVLKEMVERAWGAKIFESLGGMMEELEARKPDLWRRYPKLFAKAHRSSEII